MKAIADIMLKDQGASFRVNLGKVLPHIGDAYRGHDDPFRTHLGASVIGDECARKIWYGFHWSTKSNFEGRLLRLFNRGHLEEGRFIALLLSIGCVVYQQDEHGKQFKISDVGGHFGGSGDGVAIDIPDVPADHACLLEFKTHNDKSFVKLVKEGVRSAKFEHFVQMQVYMRKMGIAYALYMAVNKNNDDIHAEIITIDTSIGDQFIDRARNIILGPDIPKRISESAGWFACSWCSHKAICHSKKPPAVNCRTCAFSTPLEDGNWHCRVNGTTLEVIPKEKQLTGCKLYNVATVFCK